jgi:hypothetical protein
MITIFPNGDLDSSESSPKEIQELEANETLIRISETLWRRKEVPPQPEQIRGLGDIVKKVTDFVGMRQCPPCKDRQELFNKMVPNPFARS